MNLNFWHAYLFEMVICYGSLIFLSRYKGLYGLYTFAIIGPTIGNLQALKTTTTPFFDQPVALGTIIFASLNVCIEALVEYKGVQQAKQAIWLGFIAFFLFTVLLGLTVLYPPPVGNTFDVQHFQTMHQHLAAIFMPLPGMFAASLIAYVTSQYQDILIFSWLKKYWNQRYLGVRTFISTAVTGFIDSFVFSILAWIVFNPNPLSFKTVFFSYILGTYGIRLGLGMLTTPLIYWLKPITLPKT